MTSIPPINAVVIPFIPLGLTLRMDSPTLIRLNEFLMQLQYTLFMTVNFTMFVIVSIVLLPVAYVAAIIDKAKHMKYHNKED